MNHAEILEKIYRDVKDIDDSGKLASYIPELARVSPKKFGIHISTVHQYQYGVGDYKEKFSIQSISKVLALTLAYKIKKQDIWKRVGIEPSGTAFNSLVQLEADKGIPRNPFINAGAMVIADILVSHLKNPKKDFLAFVRSLSNNASINYDERVAASEKSVGYRNVALCNFIKSFGNIDNNPADVLDFYFDLCSIEMSCQELSEAFLFLAHDGKTLGGTQVLTNSQTKRINALMQTCGFYDESGEFAFKVGLPGKSGVGGGIVAIHPDKYAIAVWSPRLNPKGNSFKGVRVLEKFTIKTESSIF
jgi:glutaminase